MSACTACGHGNAPTTKYCIECGSPMERSCPACRNAVTVNQKFCGECGHDLRGSPATPPVFTPAPMLESERKQVTVLFADVARSMDLAERFEPDEWTQIITGLFTVAATAVQRFGGTVDKFTGDGLMALFGAPVAQEDHADRAALAALALVAATRDHAAKVHAEHGAEVHVRVGLNSGEVVAGDVGDSGFTAVGHTVGLAQRMESLAKADSVCLSDHTARLLGTGFRLTDLGPTSVKGAAEPVRVHRLDAAPTAARRRAGSARMVGRDAEWATLLAALDEADAGHAQVIGIVGEAGAGKSRLTDELARYATERGIGVRRTAGVSHAGTVPLLPIRALFADYFGVTETDSAAEVRAKVSTRTLELDPGLADDLPLIFDFLEVPDPERPAPQLGPETRRRRVLDLVRRLTRSRSAKTSFVFLMEDLHWFDEHSVKFLDEWLPSFPGTRTLILTNFRPEFRAPWAGRSYYRQIPLQALDPRAVHTMLTELVGSDPSLHALTEELADRAGGNPFFVEEIVRGWVEDGTLTGSPGAYSLGRSVEAVRVPASVHTVLAGRIDRLDVRTKAVLQAAAVVGRTFSVPILAAVTGTPEEELVSYLHKLCAAELLQEQDQAEYRFWHPLTQEVAHASLLGATRRRHHKATAEALLSTGPDRHEELAPLVASHFEAADDHLEAARWQIRAAHPASRTDGQLAMRRLRIAVEHLGAVPTDPETVALEVRARTLLIRVGGRGGMDPDEVEVHAAAARRAAERLGDVVTLTHLAMGTGVYRFFTGNHAGGLASFREAAEYADSTADVDLRAWTHCAGCAAYATAGPLPEGLARLEQGRKLCADDPSIGMVHAGYSVMDTMHFLGAAMEVVAGDLDLARSRLLTAFEAFRGRPVGDWLVWSQSLLAPLADFSGLAADRELARDGLEKSHRSAEETGSSLAAVKAWQATALVALLDGRPTEAAASLDRGLEIARDQRAGLVDEVSILTHLARAHLAAGEPLRARIVADEALLCAERGGARVPACGAHLVRAQALRASAGGERDRSEAAATIERGTVLARQIGATTWLAFLREEDARLRAGDLAAVAVAYETIGAHGHAARIRAEIGAV